jgi:hypothetical protein
MLVLVPVSSMKALSKTFRQRPPWMRLEDPARLRKASWEG